MVRRVSLGNPKFLHLYTSQLSRSPPLFGFRSQTFLYSEGLRYRTPSFSKVPNSFSIALQNSAPSLGRGGPTLTLAPAEHRFVRRPPRRSEGLELSPQTSGGRLTGTGHGSKARLGARGKRRTTSMSQPPTSYGEDGTNRKPVRELVLKPTGFLLRGESSLFRPGHPKTKHN